MEPQENYALKGIKNIDGILHIPLIEIVTLCRLFPRITGVQLQELVTSAHKTLQQNEELKKKIPVIETKKKSLIDKLLKRSTPDASAQKTEE